MLSRLIFVAQKTTLKRMAILPVKISALVHTLEIKNDLALLAIPSLWLHRLSSRKLQPSVV
jgi:hypothetical protein